MKDLMNFLKNKLDKHGPISDKEASARGSVYDDLEDMADGETGKGMQAVKVMAKDKPSLEAGLDKAKDIIGHGDEESPSEDMASGEESDALEQMCQDMPADEIDHAIQMLQEMKAKKASPSKY